MSAIDNGTIIGRKNAIGKLYIILVEIKNEYDNGIDIESVLETRREGTANLVLQTLKEMLKKGILDPDKIVDIYIDEEDIEDNTVMADNFLTGLLTADKRYEEGVDDPIRALLKLVYAWENQ